MKAVPSIHELWSVRNGFLVPAALDLDVNDPYHRDARRLGVQLAAAIGATHSVRLVGSAAAREPHAALPRDLDLVVLVRDPAQVNAAQARAQAVIADNPACAALPVDVVAVPVAMLLRNPLVHLPTAFQSVRLCGEALPRNALALPANWDTAAALWGGRHREARAMLGHLYRGLEDRRAPPEAIADLVQRIQKRILRLIAPIALVRMQVYTTDLHRCAALMARVEPSTSTLARAVLGDREREDTSQAAIERLTELSMQVLALDALVQRQAGLAATAPDESSRVHASLPSSR